MSLNANDLRFFPKLKEIAIKMATVMAKSPHFDITDNPYRGLSEDLASTWESHYGMAVSLSNLSRSTEQSAQV